MRLGASSARTNDTAAENTLSNAIGVVGHTHQCPTPSLGAGYPPFLRKETTVYRMVYRESTWKEFRTDQRHRGGERSVEACDDRVAGEFDRDLREQVTASFRPMSK